MNKLIQISTITDKILKNKSYSNKVKLNKIEKQLHRLDKYIEEQQEKGRQPTIIESSPKDVGTYVKDSEVIKAKRILATLHISKSEKVALEGANAIETLINYMPNKATEVKQDRSIDKVTITLLDVALRAFGINIDKSVLDIIIDCVDLIEEKGGQVDLMDLSKAIANHEGKLD